MVILRGNTYPYRLTLRQMGFQWDPRSKTWFTDKDLHEDTLADISAMVDRDSRLIMQIGNEIIDNRTHKQKYGQCEDAPCCGCCGTSYYGTAGEDY